MIRFHRLAVAEVRAADRFEAEVDATIARIAEFPEAYAVVANGHRAARITGFPYVLVYRFSAGGVPFIAAVAHTSRRSNNWTRRRERDTSDG